VIGYYVHHVGSGHLHRATAVAQALGEAVTGFSSLPAPGGWPGPWIQLDRDDDAEDQVGHTARDRLHWVPVGHGGLRSRMAQIAAWLGDVAPSVFVVDVSVEVAVLVRLHGVPVVTVVGPGQRGDAAHRLCFDVADALVGCWPPTAAGMLHGLPPEVLGRLHPVGALSRFPVTEPGPRTPGPSRVLLLAGAGGHVLTAEDLVLARKDSPDWEWTVLDRELGTWVDDPRDALCEADVVVTHGGENALAEVAAARTPAVVVPQPRPHREQETTCEVLAHGGWPAVVVDAWPREGWSERLVRARALDGDGWSGWCDGGAAGRIADVVRRTALQEAR
jgi:hypothetical protein